MRSGRMPDSPSIHCTSHDDFRYPRHHPPPPGARLARRMAHPAYHIPGGRHVCVCPRQHRGRDPQSLGRAACCDLCRPGCGREILGAKNVFTIFSGPRKSLAGMGRKARGAVDRPAIHKRRNAADRPARHLPEGLGRNRAIWTLRLLAWARAHAAHPKHPLIPIAPQRGPEKIVNTFLLHQAESAWAGRPCVQLWLCGGADRAGAGRGLVDV